MQMAVVYLDSWKLRSKLWGLMCYGSAIIKYIFPFYLTACFNFIYKLWISYIFGCVFTMLLVFFSCIYFLHWQTTGTRIKQIHIRKNIVVGVFAFKMKTSFDVLCSSTTMAADSAPPLSKRTKWLIFGGHKTSVQFRYSVLMVRNF